MTFRFGKVFPVLVLWVLVLSFSSAIDTPKPVRTVITKRYQLTGKDELKIMSTAITQALRSGVGRIYFTNMAVRSQHLLDAYLEKQADEFVVRRTIHSNELRGGLRYMDIEVVVDVKKIWEDLNEKRFMFRPAFRPVYTAFIEEVDQDGTPVAQPEGRSHLIQTLNDKPNRRFRFLWTDKVDNPLVSVAEKTEVPVEGFPGTKDVSENLAKARAEAERYGVEFIITGKITSKKTRSEILYLDKEPTNFVQSAFQYKVVRCDTGLVLTEGEVKTVAGHLDMNEAIAKASRAAVENMIETHLKDLDLKWGKTTHLRADYRLMAADFTADQLQALLRHMEGATGIYPPPKVYDRGAYGDVTVWTFDWQGDIQKFIERLRDVRYPKYKVDFIEPDGLIIEIL